MTFTFVRWLEVKVFIYQKIWAKAALKTSIFKFFWPFLCYEILHTGITHRQFIENIEINLKSL